MAYTSMKQLADEYVAKYEANEKVLLDFSGYIVELVTNSKALKDKLDFYFKDFILQGMGTPNVHIKALEAPSPEPADLGLEFNVKQPDPGKTKIKEEFINFADGRLVRKRITGMLFLFGGDTHVAVGPCVENDNQIVNFINNRFIQHTLNSGCFLFHAAGVAKFEQGLSMAGFSGMGKSTLALHIMTEAKADRDVVFISNDRLMVKKDGPGLTMYGVAKMPRINPGTILNNDALTSLISAEDRAKFEALPIDELWQLEHKYDGFIDQCYGPGRFKMGSPMTGLILLNWKRNDDPLTIKEIDIDTRDDLMPAFMKDTGMFYLEPEGGMPDYSVAAYRNLMKGCPVYELSGGIDFQKAAKFCVGLLNEGPVTP